MKRIPVYLFTIVLTVLASYVVFAGFSYQEQESIGYIDANRIFNEYSEFEVAAQKLEAERAPYEERLQQMQDEFNTRREEFENMSLLMSDEKRAQTNKELSELYQQIQEYGQQHFGPEGTMAQMSAELTDPIIEKVRVQIQTLGKDLGYDFIIDGSSDAVLYANETKDMTELLLKELEKK